MILSAASNRAAKSFIHLRRPKKLKAQLDASRFVDLVKRGSFEANPLFVNFQRRAITTKQRREPLGLPSGEIQISDLRHHHRPAENRAEKKNQQDDLSFDRGFEKGINKAFGKGSANGEAIISVSERAPYRKCDKLPVTNRPTVPAPIAAQESAEDRPLRSFLASPSRCRERTEIRLKARRGCK